MENPEPFTFIILAIDFFMQESNKERKEPVIRIRGRDIQSDKVVIVYLKGFHPYFYIYDLPETKNTVQTLLQHRKDFANWIRGVEYVSKYTYYQHKRIFLYKIIGNDPWQIKTYASLLEKKGIKSIEKDIPYITRFLIDTGLRGLNLAILRNYVVLHSNGNGRIFEAQYSDVSSVVSEKKYEKEATENSHIVDSWSYLPTIMSLKIFIDNRIVEENDKKRTIKELVEEGKRRIIAFSISWGKTIDKISSKHFILKGHNDENERQLILDAWNFIHNKISPDVIITFKGNSIDFPYLLARIKELGLSPSICSPFENGKLKEPTSMYGYRIAGYMVYDISSKSKWMRLKGSQDTLANFVGQYLGKERSVTTKELSHLWVEGVINGDHEKLGQLEKVIDQDTQLVYELFIELGFPEWLEVMKIVGIQPSKGIYSTARHLGEFELIRNLYANNILIPPYPSKKEKEERKLIRIVSDGGYVMRPEGTIHEAVLITDFSSMYPSVIVTHNIGGESFRGITYSFEECFLPEPVTALSKMELKLLTERKKVKQDIQELEIFIRSFPNNSGNHQLITKLKQLKIRSKALKVIANSIFGSHNYIGSRFFNTDIANAITYFSKVYIDKIAKWTEEYSNGKCKVVYGDTDSAFIKLSRVEDVFNVYYKVKRGEVFDLDDVPEVKNILTFFNSRLTGEMNLEFVDLAVRIIFAKETKKRYSYLSAVTNKLEIVGFEAIRADIPEFTKKIQKAAFRVLLEDGSTEKAKRAVIKLCESFKNKKGSDLLKLITVYGPVRKLASKYKNKTPAIGALIDYSIEKGISVESLQQSYTRFPYVIIKGDQPLYKRAKHPSLIKRTENIDIDYYIEQALRTVKRIGLNIELKEIKVNENTIFDWWD